MTTSTAAATTTTVNTDTSMGPPQAMPAAPRCPFGLPVTKHGYDVHNDYCYGCFKATEIRSDEQRAMILNLELLLYAKSMGVRAELEHMIHFTTIDGTLDVIETLTRLCPNIAVPIRFPSLDAAANFDQSIVEHFDAAYRNEMPLASEFPATITFDVDALDEEDGDDEETQADNDTNTNDDDDNVD